MEHVADIISCHSANGSLTFVSAAAERLIRAPGEALGGDGFLERIHPVDRPAFLTAISRAAHRGTATSVAFRLRIDAGPRDGQGSPAAGAGTVWLETCCRPLRPDKAEPGSGPHEVVAVSRDVTERKTLEEALLRKRNEAEAANRAKSRFLAAMSHELRTPLNAVIGFADLLCDRDIGDMPAEQQREYPRIIRQSGQRLLGLVNDILDVSRLESDSFEVNPQTLDVAELVEACRRAMAAEAARAGLELRCEVPDTMPEIVADEGACRRILHNLVANAIKFSEPGGSVALSAKVDRSSVILAVADSGIGIAPDELRHLTAPFARAAGSLAGEQGGAGLGLSMVRGIARLHGGSMKIESEPGAGTRVSVSLPLAPHAAGNGAPDPKIVRLKQPA